MPIIYIMALGLEDRTALEEVVARGSDWPGRLHEGSDQRRGIDEGFKTRGQHTQCPTKRAARACWRPLPMCRTHARELADIRGMS